MIAVSFYQDAPWRALKVKSHWIKKLGTPKSFAWQIQSINIFVTIILNLNFNVKEYLYFSPKLIFLFIFIFRYLLGRLGKLSFVIETKNQEQCSLLFLSETIKVLWGNNSKLLEIRHWRRERTTVGGQGPAATGQVDNTQQLSLSPLEDTKTQQSESPGM